MSEKKEIKIISNNEKQNIGVCEKSCNNCGVVFEDKITWCSLKPMICIKSKIKK